MIKSGLLFICFCAAGFLSHAQLSVQHLLCEQKQEPLGIGVAQPRLSWQLSSARRNVRQTAYEIRTAANPSSLRSGKALWKSGKIASDQSVFVPYGGSTLEAGHKYFWQVRVWDNQGNVSAWSAPASWQMGLLQPSDWKAQWIVAGNKEEGDIRPSPLFRKQFSAAKKIRSATLYVTAHGLYEAKLNGQKIGNDYLTPGWTSYNKRLQYQVYDVTSMLKQGPNVIGAMLGSGWYRGYLAWGGNKDSYGHDIALLLQLDLTYDDGSTETIATDGSWKSAVGPVRSSEIYNGEQYDARMEKTGWLNAGYNDQDWTSVRVENFSKNNIIPTVNEPVRKHETFRPLRIFKTPKGEQVIDFGQNLVGWVQVKLSGSKGDSIRLSHAEVLDKEGNFYTENLRAAKQQNTYFLKGGGEESFEPHFTFQGFRYVKVDGYTGQLKPENFTAVALYSDMTPTGTFATSDTLLNKLQHNIQWGQRGNFLDVPTDCPQRDERLGWTGDAQVFSRTAAFNMNVNNFFAKWLKDVAADQRPDGAVPHVVPNVLDTNSVASTGWADVSVIVPWNMYLAYGDKKILEDQYPSMKAWVNYMQQKSKNDLWNSGFHFGDWLFYHPEDDNDGRAAITDKYLIAQAFYAHSTQLLINAAKVLNRTEDVTYYSNLLLRIRDAFMKEYVTPNGRLVSSTQTAYVLALNFDLLPEALRSQAAERLVQNIRSYGNHLTTGFLGTPYLCHVLTRFGYTDVAYALLMQQSYPSWLYPVKMGATTIWERWDGIKPDGSFENAGMNSFNHYSYGAIGDWMYRVMTGIDTDESGPGYKRSVIMPHPNDTLSSAGARLQTYYGLLSSEWKQDKNSFQLHAVVPPNTSAVVYIPAKSVNDIREGGHVISSVKELQVKGMENGYAVMEVGSGDYTFTVSK